MMKHHLLFPNSLLISFEEEGVGFEKKIASLLNYLDFNDVLLNLRTTGHITNWVQNFSLYLCDSSFGNEKLMKHFFPNYPIITNGIYANLEHRQRFVLKEME